MRARAILVAVMVVPHVPLGALVALLFAATMFAPPFDSAKASITPDILHGERYVLGTAVLQTTLLTGEVLGAVGGGVAVAFIGVPRSLAIDAATFVLSGLLVGLGLRARPPAARPESARPSPVARMRDGFRLVFGDRALSTLLLFGWLIVFYTVPAGIAAPYVARIGGGPIATGAVIASTALGTMLALPPFTRFVRPRQRVNVMGPLAVLTCGTLILTGLRPGLAVSLVIFVVSAAFGVYQVAANTAFVVRVPAPAAGSGLRYRQHGGGRRPGGRLRGGRRRRGGGRSGDGHRGCGWSGCGCCVGPDDPVASRVTTWGASCGQPASRARRGLRVGAASRIAVAAAAGHHQVHVSRISHFLPIGIFRSCAGAQVHAMRMPRPSLRHR